IPPGSGKFRQKLNIVNTQLPAPNALGRGIDTRWSRKVEDELVLVEKADRLRNRLMGEVAADHAREPQADRAKTRRHLKHCPNFKAHDRRADKITKTALRTTIRSLTSSFRTVWLSCATCIGFGRGSLCRVSLLRRGRNGVIN